MTKFNIVSPFAHFVCFPFISFVLVLVSSTGFCVRVSHFHLLIIVLHSLHCFVFAAVHLCRQITSRPQACPPTVRHVKLLADLYVDAFECTQKISVSGVYLGISNLPLELRMKISEGLPCAFEPKCEDRTFA